MDGFGVVGAGKWGLVEFADFDCSFCRRFVVDVWPTLNRDYVETGKLRFAFRHYPLPSHPQAIRHAAATECAGAQGQFWTVHDRLFAAPGVDDAAYVSVTKDIPLDRAKFERCLDEPSPQVEQDRALGSALKITGTPTFFFGQINDRGQLVVSRTLIGTRPLGEFRAILDDVMRP